MNKVVLVSIILVIITLSGCSSDDFSVKSGHPPAEKLSDYLPAEKFEFWGESGYYHYYRDLSIEEQSDQTIVYISGEVKDNSGGLGKNDHRFQIELWVDSEKMVQRSSGQMLNDSEFVQLILLKTPIIEEASWEFDAYDKNRKKHVVTGRIIKIDEENESIEVEYTSQNGNIEKRTLEKNRGTTSFVKQIAYKDAVTYTGYHLIPVEDVQTNDAVEANEYDTLAGIEIDLLIYELIDEFNIRWVNYIKNFDQSLLELIEVDSKAYLKVINIKDDSIPLNDYIGFKPYKLEYREDTTLVYVLEKFMVNDESHYNSICYEVIETEERYYISDFYLANP